MFSFFYQIAIYLLALISLPKLFHEKYRRALGHRLGQGFENVQRKDNGRLIWIHAVSMGETKAAAALAKVWKSHYPNDTILFTNITETGHAEAKRALPFADYHLFLPFDISWVINPIVKRLKPDVILLCETDFWYNFLHTAKQEGAQIFLVNGKISEKTTHRMQKFPFFAKEVFSLFTLFCVQSQHYADRFESLGVPSEKIVVTGNLKFDDNASMPSEETRTALKQELGVKPNDQVVVVGSTHHPEEQELLSIFQEIWKEHPHVKLILVPRHPERFDTVAKMLADKNITHGRFSQKQTEGQVLLVDAMGVLDRCYQIADLALVGGSFADTVGGHNIFEPSRYGKPVIFGPYMWSQPQLVELLLSYKAGVQTPLTDLQSTLLALLQNDSERMQLSRAAFKMAEEMKGSTEKTFSSIVK